MRSQRCRNCEYYSAYYKQRSSGYEKLNKGFCSKHQKEETQFKTCENFTSNEHREKIKEQLRLDALDGALKSINEIAQILKEKNK
ncbi:MAG: hypothetical protein FWE84_01580 [Firmicutes bacterium]|nr:hypothetical protein [Bacillota bacterium]